MASLVTGILLDVSGSMRENYELNNKGGYEPDEKWIRSIFDTIDNLIECKDVSSDHSVFALAVGGSLFPIFDIFNTLENTNDCEKKQKMAEILYNKQFYERNMDLSSVLSEAASIVIEHGAPHVLKWAPIRFLLKHISYEDALQILLYLRFSEEMRTKIVMDILPVQCREGHAMASAAYFCPITFATKENICEAVNKIKMYARKKRLYKHKLLRIDVASKLLRGSLSFQQKLTQNNIKQLVSDIEPYIYGKTPLIEALGDTSYLFGLTKAISCEVYRMLFILSDGMHTDEGDLPVKDLNSMNVKTFGCYITKKNISNPRCLYANTKNDWDEGAKFLWGISSTVPTQDLPRTIFIKRGWEIEESNNETRLFVQINHPSIIDEVTDLAKNIVFSRDALADLVSSIHLDVHVNQTLHEFGAPKQDGGTCYANATASVIYFATRRIIGRCGGWPNFYNLRQEIICQYGYHGANTKKVLTEVCPKYRLRVNEVSIQGALKAIIAKRPVVAAFWLNETEWQNFSNFYEKDPSGILTKADLNISSGQDGEAGGHAVVLVGFNSSSLRFMNSWGDKWGNKGFFRVKDHTVLGKLRFFDVYFTIGDLYFKEEERYKTYSLTESKKLFMQLKSLKESQFCCPLCKESSLVTEFTGSMEKVICPKCQGEFSMRNADANVALAIYLLLSLK